MYKLIKCNICYREFNGQISGSHLKTHGTNVQEYELIYGPSRDPQLILDAKSGGKKGGGNQAARNSLISKSKQFRAMYNQNPLLCKVCSGPLAFENRRNECCSHSCSAKLSNKNRMESGWSLSDESRAKIRKKLSKQKIENEVIYPHSKISTMCCSFCNTLFITRRSNRKRICKNCEYLKWNNNKDAYSFRFNVFDFPDLFDLALLENTGWVAFGGKRGGKKNPNGISRDHRVSITDAKRFNYDPYYISHPLNCELMPHTLNNKKKTASSMLYEDLVKLVDNYDKINRALV